MQEEIPTKAIGACFGLAAFVIAIVAGLIAGNPAEDVLTHAVPALAVCSVVGYVIGSFTTKAISDNIQNAAAAAAEAATRASEEAARIAQLENEGAPPATGPAPTAGTPARPAAAKPVPATTTISTPARPVGTGQSRRPAA